MTLWNALLILCSCRPPLPRCAAITPGLARPRVAVRIAEPERSELGGAGAAWGSLGSKEDSTAHMQADLVKQPGQAAFAFPPHASWHVQHCRSRAWAAQECCLESHPTSTLDVHPILKPPFATAEHWKPSMHALLHRTTVQGYLCMCACLVCCTNFKRQGHAACGTHLPASLPRLSPDSTCEQVAHDWFPAPMRPFLHAMQWDTPHGGWTMRR